MYPLFAVYDDVENFPNKFTADYLFVLNQTESDLPRVNQPSLDQLKVLNAKWATLKGRADEMIKIRGISVYPTAIERVLRSFPELGLDWQLVVDRKISAKEALVEVEALGDILQVLQLLLMGLELFILLL